MFRALLKYVFDTYSLRRISAEVPEFLGPRFTEFIEKEVKLKREGVRRRGAYYDSKFYNVALYGILPEELDDNDYSLNTEESTELQETT
jgi:RimJ/RimL family protein N-acetyltransferase